MNNKAIAPRAFNGSCTTKVFETWVEQTLIKELKPGQVVVMDNASFHKSEKVKERVASVRCKVFFLPPYVPDLNPIEKFWANMKRWIQRNISQFLLIFDAISAFFNMSHSN